jgi:hypothetical protein
VPSHHDVVVLAGHRAAQGWGCVGAAGTCSLGRTAKTTQRASSESDTAPLSTDVGCAYAIALTIRPVLGGAASRAQSQ